MVDLDDLPEFIAVVRSGGFREAARSNGKSPSSLSEAVRRLEARVGVRLLNRTTRSVTPTEAGWRLMERLDPALGEVEAALDVVNRYRDRPFGTLRLNVPAVAARLVLPRFIPAFLEAYPDIRVEIIAEDSFVDVLAAGCDAGIRYDERLEQDMIAVPIGPRTQRFATAAAPGYLDRKGRPTHPRDLLGHTCLIGRFSSGAETSPWEFERAGEIVRIEPPARLTVSVGTATDLAIATAIEGGGVIQLFEDWLTPHIETGRLEPILPDWWQLFTGPFLYYSGRRQLPGPLRAFVDFTRDKRW
ncbi:LysR family transcriptional regulator [Fulvimarina sp. MAC3]|uniref:LysR family transcriptional regulator n=1 Tax=Fulvimarina sp. MAC3 TaxID=3148887 RepID=UPI0031FC22AD